MKVVAKVIIPNHIKSDPEPHEVEVAQIFADHYQCTVEFIVPSEGYRRKTPDIISNGVMWEIKSPTGLSRRNTIKYQFETAMRQADSLILDGRRTKLQDSLIHRQIVTEIKKRTRVRRVIFITKEKKIVEFFR